MQSAFIVVDEDRCGNMHGVNQAKPFADPALVNEFLDLWGNIEESAPPGNFKPEMFGERFQDVLCTIRKQPRSNKNSS